MGLGWRNSHYVSLWHSKNRKRRVQDTMCPVVFSLLSLLLLPWGAARARRGLMSWPAPRFLVRKQLPLPRGTLPWGRGGELGLESRSV